MSIACRICVAEKGLKGSEIDSLPETQEELIEHLESVHHMAVIREGESEMEAQARLAEKYPEVADCEECSKARREREVGR